MKELQELRKIGATVNRRRGRPARPDKVDDEIITLKLDKAVVRQFKAWCAANGVQHRHAGGKALNLFFRAYGMPTTADEGPLSDEGFAEG